MGIEIDFLAVGDKAKSGDAIALRFGNLHGKREEQTILTIDGGTKESGDKLVAHVKEYYGSDSVDFAFLTHPDADHASGMRSVLENLKVGQVIMHRPWLHSAAIKKILDDDRTSTTSIKARTTENLDVAYEIEDIATKKGIKIVEPFAGVANSSGSIRVLGPSENFYTDMLAQFDFMPGVKASMWFSSLATRAVKWIAEKWDDELLVEPDEDATSAENNSSMVLLISVDDQHYLFTGDAGVPALAAALEYAATIAIDWTKLRFLQAPHHGSKRNLGPTVLNRLLGKPSAHGNEPTKTAFISAAKEGEPKHPSKRIVNALHRRGTKSFATAGVSKRHHLDAPERAGWSVATPLPFYPQVEDDD